MARLEIHVDEPMGYHDFYAARMEAGREPSWPPPDLWIIGVDRMSDIAKIQTTTGPLLQFRRTMESQGGHREADESILGLPVEWSSRPERLGKASLVFKLHPELRAYPSPAARYQADPRFRALVLRIKDLLEEDEYFPMEILEAVKFVAGRPGINIASSSDPACPTDR